MPAQRAFPFAERSEPPARLTAGLEGLRLQAQQRPAECRRAPSAPPKYKTPAQAGVFICTSIPMPANAGISICGAERAACAALDGARRDSLASESAARRMWASPMRLDEAGQVAGVFICTSIPMPANAGISICGVERAACAAHGGARRDSLASESAARRMWASPMRLDEAGDTARIFICSAIPMPAQRVFPFSSQIPLTLS